MLIRITEFKQKKKNFNDTKRKLFITPKQRLYNKNSADSDLWLND